MSRLHSLAFALILDGAGRVLLVRHNYSGRYYALPGGEVEPGELPQEAAMREVREELCIEARATRLLSINSFVLQERYQAHVFLAEIVDGEPAHPGTEEIAEVGWFDPEQLPRPVYVTVELAIADARRGEYGILREIR
jgi:8-oxo-dGTP diphosphatase